MVATDAAERLRLGTLLEQPAVDLAHGHVQVEVNLMAVGLAELLESGVHDRLDQRHLEPLLVEDGAEGKDLLAAILDFDRKLRALDRAREELIYHPLVRRELFITKRDGEAQAIVAVLHGWCGRKNGHRCGISAVACPTDLFADKLLPFDGIHAMRAKACSSRCWRAVIDASVRGERLQNTVQSLLQYL